MRTISDDERRARLALRHGLAASAGNRAADVTTLAGALAGLHATDPATVFLAARARLAEPSVAGIEAALYEQRTLVRILGMRRTMFVVPAQLVPVVQAFSTRALVPGERKRFAALLHAFGPGALADLKWWTGWTMGLVKRALAPLDVAEVALADGAKGLVLAEGAAPVAAPEQPWIALLPTLDRAPMGWRERSWYLGEHRAACFDRSGNIGPTVWCDGRIVGGWAQRKASGEVVVRLLEDIGAEAQHAVAEDAARLRSWIGEARVTPRFRTPLERELAG